MNNYFDDIVDVEIPNYLDTLMECECCGSLFDDIDPDTMICGFCIEDQLDTL